MRIHFLGKYDELDHTLPEKYIDIIKKSPGLFLNLLLSSPLNSNQLKDFINNIVLSAIDFLIRLDVLHHISKSLAYQFIFQVFVQNCPVNSWH